MGLGDAGSFVRDLDDGPAVRMAPNVDPDGSSARRVLDRVVDQVDQRLSQDEPVDVCSHGRIATHFDALPLLLGEDLEQRGGFACQLEEDRFLPVEADAGIRA